MVSKKILVMVLERVVRPKVSVVVNFDDSHQDVDGEPVIDGGCRLSSSLPLVQSKMEIIKTMGYT